MVYQTYGGTINNTNSMSSDQNRKIFLGGLNYNTTDETLRAFCSRFGKTTDCLVMRNPDRKSRGFGFVTYEDTSSVEDFMRSRPHTIDDRQIDPKRAMPREDQNSTEAHLTVKKLFIAGLREGIDEDNLRQHFSRFGNITEVLVMKDRDSKPRGFAFVTYDDYDAVDKAILGKPHLINGRTLDVKKAVPKDKGQETPTSTGGNSSAPSSNRNNSSNYSTRGSRNNFGSMRDNYSNGSWDNQGGMARMNNQNQDYNQPQTSSYNQQGYNSGGSTYNSSMLSSANSYPQSYNSMEQNQPTPSQQPLMNYGSYSNNNNNNMPYNNNNANQLPTSNYMPPPPPPQSSYGQNQQQSFGGNSNDYPGLNSLFNLPSQQTNSGGISGYNGGSSSSTSFDNSSSYGHISQNYGNTSGNFNNMPQQQQQQQSRGQGPMRRGRGGGSGNHGSSSDGFGGNNNSSSYGNRSAPYPTRGSRGGGSGGLSNPSGRGRGRGRGRGQ